MKMRRLWMPVAVCVALACGSSTEPTDPLVGDWIGTVGAVGARAAASVKITILPDGKGGYDGIALVAIGKDSLIYIDPTIAPFSDGAIEIDLFDDILNEPPIFYSAKRTGDVMAGTIDGPDGPFHKDQLTLGKQR